MPSSTYQFVDSQDSDDTEFYATCGAGLESLLAAELKDLGLARVQTAGAGVRFHGNLAAAYRACLWSRIANRVIMPIHSGAAASPEALYGLAQEINWADHVDVDGTLAVDFYTANSAITHSQYGALKVKDAVVDQFRDAMGRRPNVERETPDLRINVYLFRDKARIAIDLSGSSLHRRDYRQAGGLAPLKENLAAALLLSADWPAKAEQGLPLVDPMCGSGTLLIEAAMIACHQAPGLQRAYFGFLGWKGHDAAVWQQLREEALAARRESPALIVGSDQDEQAVANCRLNLEQAGLSDAVIVQNLPLANGRADALQSVFGGLLMTNPPYGERLAGDASFYSELGRNLSRYYGGWQCALFTATDAPYARARLPLGKHLRARNGGIDCVLLTGRIPATGKQPASSLGVDTASESDHRELKTAVDSSLSETVHPQAALYRGRSAAGADAEKLQEVFIDAQQTDELFVDAVPFANRLKKNQRGLKGWIKQTGIRAYRLYDSDLPEFAVAIDVYNAEQATHCVVQEYQAPATVNVAMAEARLKALMAVIPTTLNIEAKNVHLKVREVKSGLQQYEKRSGASSTISIVEELGGRLEVNFTDYLDTGLFLDHRPVRKYIGSNSQGKRFLNLFAYTATATVAAVTGGASSSVSVDTSNRYCQWAMRNLDRNGAAQQLHEVVRQDVFNWLDSAALGIQPDSMFDLILLDPPTFSNSSDIEDDWNVQRDHVKAIDACLGVLAPGGTLIFSNNYRRFKLDPTLAESGQRGIEIEDRSRWSIDRDFQRNSRIHQCWFIRKQG